VDNVTALDAIHICVTIIRVHNVVLISREKYEQQSYKHENNFVKLYLLLCRHCISGNGKTFLYLNQGLIWIYIRPSLQVSDKTIVSEYEVRLQKHEMIKTKCYLIPKPS